MTWEASAERPPTVAETTPGALRTRGLAAARRDRGRGRGRGATSARGGDPSVTCQISSSSNPQGRKGGERECESPGPEVPYFSDSPQAKGTQACIHPGSVVSGRGAWGSILEAGKAGSAGMMWMNKGARVGTCRGE